MIKAKVSTDYKDIERIFAGGTIQKEIIKVWSTESDAYVFEAWRVLEMEGPLPLTFNANGEPLIDYRIYGNTEQTGTPTPESPIMPIGCGERTENLWNRDEVAQIQVASDASIVRYGIAFSGSAFSLCLISDSAMFYKIKTGNTYGTAGQLSVGVVVAITLTNDQTLLVYGSGLAYAQQATIQINSGTSYIRYEPYGYKLPILSNSTVTNIYIGSDPLGAIGGYADYVDYQSQKIKRQIKTRIFNGSETFIPISQYQGVYTLPIVDHINNDVSIAYSSNYYAWYQWISNGAQYGQAPDKSLMAFVGYGIYVKDMDYLTSADFKNHVKELYDAGTPLAVTYVTREYYDTDPPVPLPAIPTFNGSTTMDYDGGEKHFITSDGYVLVDKNQNGFLLSGSTDSLRPEKMYIKYKGR